MKYLTTFLWFFIINQSCAQSLQISVEAGLQKYRNFGSAQVERYLLSVRTPVTSNLGATGYTVGIYGRLMTKSPLFFQIGIRHSGQETGVQYIDTQPSLPTTEDDIDVSYAGNYLYHLDVPVLAGVGGQISSRIRLEGYIGVLPTLNRYKYTGDYEPRFSWTAQIIDQSLKPLSWSYCYGTTLWLKRWGLTLAREASFASLHRNIVYKEKAYPFSFGYRSTRLSVSYRFGRVF